MQNFTLPVLVQKRTKLPTVYSPPSIYSNEKYRKKIVKFIHNVQVKMNKTAGKGILPLSWIYKNISELNLLCFAISFGEWWRVFYNYKTWDFDVTYHNIVWNSENVLLGMTWTFQDLTFEGSWVTEYHNGIFFLCIPCHSRHRAYLQCHCQLKLKTGGRYNDAEPRASIISCFLISVYVWSYFF